MRLKMIRFDALADSKKAFISDDELMALQQSINASTDVVAVTSLRTATKSEFSALQHGAEGKRKTYTCGGALFVSLIAQIVAGVLCG